MGRIRSLWILFGLVLCAASISDFRVSADVIPSENECRPYIEKAIHELKNVEAGAGGDDNDSAEGNDSIDTDAVPETGTDDDGNDSTEETGGKSDEVEKSDDNQSEDDSPSQENQTEENASIDDATKEDNSEDGDDSKQQGDSTEDDKSADKDDSSKEDLKPDDDGDSKEAKSDDSENSNEAKSEGDENSKEQTADDGDSKENDGDSKENEGDSKEQTEGETQEADDDSKENAADDGNDSKENDTQENDTQENQSDDDDGNDSTQTAEEADQDSQEPTESAQANDDGDSAEKNDSKADDSTENGDDNQTNEVDGDSKEDDKADGDSKEDNDDTQNDTKEDESVEETVRAKRSLPDEANDTNEDDNNSNETANDSTANDSTANDSQENDDDNKSGEADNDDDSEEKDLTIEDLTMEFEIPKNLRPRGHVSELLGLDAESSIKENALKRTGDVVLKELKKVFDNAIKPLETMYKYRDLSNRHFGDPEIFSKPLILFMGPWSGGKSTILNYLTDNEYTPNSIRSGAEPSPAYFNILMHGDEPEVLDGTQLAADWTFSGLQKFGQGLMDRLRGQKLPSKLLERVNIVEIPGILEVRKQVSRFFPFNDACQWFIDRADIIILVYDPSKLDAGPETEAILDQLKGREYQTRIILNKADQVKPEELLRVQGALIWNISPLMSSAQPPVMYTVSLWSHPYENGAPIRLLQAQERAFLSDLREAIDKRIENKIASARRFAVRIRNHAKMVDCYLTTYYNQKGLFSNKKQVADKIIEHPQNYNIYEGLSTLTNISRYDLPDPEVYLDFFRLNPLYEFKKLSDTCTYFKGCPINKLDIAIAYELPELVGKYKKLLEQNLIELRKEYDENCNQTEPELPVKIIKSR